MIDALVKHLGIVTNACKEVGIARQTHYEWYAEDPKYKNAVDDISEVALDFAEEMLFEQMRKKDTTAIIFYLKTRGKSRGYIEKVDHGIIFDSPPVIKIIKGNGASD